MQNGRKDYHSSNSTDVPWLYIGESKISGAQSQEMCRWNSVVGSGLAFCVKQVLKRQLFDLPNWSAFLFRWRKACVIFWTNWKTTLIVTQSYAFFPTLSQWWGYVYLYCVSIGSLNFLPLLWLAVITWLKMVFLRSIQHWRVIGIARRNQTLSPKAREEHRQ